LLVAPGLGEPSGSMEGHDLSLTTSSGFSRDGSVLPLPLQQPKTHGYCCNALCKLSCCCCFTYVPALHPLFLSFEFVPLRRKLAWVWLIVAQFLVLHFPTQLMTWLILGAFGTIVLLSLLWALASRGFHRGLGLLQLAFWIPMTIYLIARLAGVDQDGRDRPLRQHSLLFGYVIVEVVTLGLACLLSFWDALQWLSGGASARVWGHAAVHAQRSHGEYLAVFESGESSPSIQRSLAPSPPTLVQHYMPPAYDTAGSVVGVSAYGDAPAGGVPGRRRPSDAMAIGSGGGGSISGLVSSGGSLLGDPSSSLQSPGASLLSATPNSFLTPRAHSELLLSRAEQVIREQQQQQLLQVAALQRLQEQEDAQRRRMQEQQGAPPALSSP